MYVAFETCISLKKPYFFQKKTHVFNLFVKNQKETIEFNLENEYTQL